jgi:hypothetical protein
VVGAGWGFLDHFFIFLFSPTSRIQLAEHAFLFFFVNDFQGR